MARSDEPAARRSEPHVTTALAVLGRARDAASRRSRDALFRRVMLRIERYFVKLVWNIGEVEDCLQDALLRIERGLQDGAYDPSRSFNRWMWTIAHRVFVDHCRRVQRRPRADCESQVAIEGSGFAQVDARLDAATVLEHLRRELNPEALEIFMLHFDQRQSLSKIAQVTGRDRKTVRTRLEEARALAKRLLDRHG